MEKSVLERHIATFVNDYSLNLSEDGMAAVSALKKMAKHAEVIP